MAVVGIAREKVGAREKNLTSSDVTYKRVFLVRSNNVKDDPNVIERAFGLPKLGFNYTTGRSVDMSVQCTRLESRQLSHLMWEVVAEYSTIPVSGGTVELPEFEPPTFRWGNKQIREVITGESTFQDYDIGQDPSGGLGGKIVRWLNSTGILNSAYEPYMPPAEIDRLIPTLTIVRNEPSFNVKYMLYYVNCVNRTRWYGFWPRTVKVEAITGDFKTKVVDKILYKYWQVTYQLAFNKATWDLYLLDQGSYYFLGGKWATDLVKVPFNNKGTPTLGLLTSDGDKSTSVARFNRYRVLDELNIQRLMLPFYM